MTLQTSQPTPQAQAAQRVCIRCGHPIHLCTRAYSRPGGVHSSAGAKESRRTGLCEHCSDNTATPQ